MRARLILTWLAFLLLCPSAAFASLADEERQGQALSAQLQAGTKSCGELSAGDFDHLGEYVMGRFLGSTSAHEAMNQRMRAMMGEQAEGRMHQLLGARYAGCTAAAAGGAYGPMMGGRGMMGGYYGSGGWSAMMSSGDYSWMMGGGWRQMSRSDWQRLQRQWLGVSTGEHGGWSSGAIAAVAVVGTLLVVGLAMLALRRRPFRRPRGAPSP